MNVNRKNIIIGALIGRILGSMTDFLIISGNVNMTLTVIGIFIGGGIGGLSKIKKNDLSLGDKVNNARIHLREEQLDISKKTVKTAEVTMQTETIRIPISEERIEIVKYPVILENVAISQKQFQDIQCIEEDLKKEKLSLKITGDIKIIDKEV